MKIPHLIVALLFCCLARPVIGSTTNNISPGQTITDETIAAAGQTNFYAFTAVPNEALSILMTRTSDTAGSPYFELYDPTGALVAGPGYEDGVTAYLFGFPLTQNGTYLIACRDATNATFVYNLTLIKTTGGNLADEETMAIAPGQTLTNKSIGVPADIDVFTFTGASNEAVSILMTISGGAGSFPRFELYGPNGAPVGSPGYRAGLAAYLDGLRLTQTGTYLIACRDDGGDETFNYNLTLVKTTGGNDADEDTIAITPGQTLTNKSISVPADIDIFTFTGTSNEAVSILMTKTDDSGDLPFFELYGPDGALMANPGYRDGVIAYLDGFWLAQSGTYLIACRDAGGNQPFAYNLTLVKCPGPNLTDPGEGSEIMAPGETRFATIGVGDIDAFSFSAVAGDFLDLNLKRIGGSGQNPLLRLYAPDCTLADSISAAPNSARIRIPCLPQTGVYTILCRDGTGFETFEYSLALTLNPGPPPSYDPAHPYVTEFRCGTDLVTRWPTNAAGFELQFCEDLCAMYAGGQCYGAWTNVAPPYAVIGDHYFVTNRSSASARFYRLVQPAN